ncbi:MAG TPA: DNA mismatch repair protein MutS, partial [Flavipsychrobacter sp.]|nr:DNA mismatch repair protein MutS [Flavipsychrobacter sp.]
MMQLYPAHAAEALEFNKICELLKQKCRTDSAKERVASLRFHTRLDFVERALLQTDEYRQLLSGSDYFPNDFTRNIQKELKLLGVPNAVLSGEQLLSLQQLSLSIRDVMLWFKRHNDLYPNLKAVAEKIVYEKAITEIISAVVDENGNVRDSASRELMQIRTELSRLRGDLRRTFESILRKLNKQGYLADISEGFLNGRRTVAVAAEYKRVVKGILHGESETSKTVFIEPEEVIELNNEIFSLERAEGREIHRILALTTATLSLYQPQLEAYYHVVGLYDFIRAKALLAKDMNAQMPGLSPHPGFHLVKAFHPLLLLHNNQSGKQTVPTNITLDRNNRILIISGPNAGGKTVTMKT